jgi:hypothetical protein
VTHPSAIPVFVRLFRSAASIDIDKNDVRRFRDFVDEQIDDLAIAGRNSAKWNGRDVISPQDLPITKGVQERMREFDKLEEAERIRELLRQQVRRPTGRGHVRRGHRADAARSVRRPQRRPCQDASGHRPKIDQPNQIRLGAVFRVVQADLLTACEGTPVSAATPRSPPVSQKVKSIPGPTHPPHDRVTQVRR